MPLELILVFSRINRMWIFVTLPSGEMLVHPQHFPFFCFRQFSLQFLCTLLCSWTERGNVKRKCLFSVQSQLAPASAWTRTAGFGVQRNNHRVLVPPFTNNNLACAQTLLGVEREGRRICKGSFFNFASTPTPTPRRACSQTYNLEPSNQNTSKSGFITWFLIKRLLNLIIVIYYPNSARSYLPGAR